jgi:hypothetical protein
MHDYANTFGIDPEVYEYVGQHIALLDTFNLRVYHNAKEKKKTDEREGTRTWQSYVQGHMMDQEGRTALSLLLDESFRSDKARSREFARLTGQAERTFYRLRDRIRDRLGVVGAVENQCHNVTLGLTA